MQTKKLKEVVISKKWKKPKITISEYQVWYSPYILIAQMEWKDVVEYTNENCPKCDKNDILMVWDWSIWKIATNLEWVIWSTIVKLTPNWIEKEYLYYFLQFSKPIILANPKWTWLAHINPDIFWNLEIPIFSPDQQHLIVSEIEKQFSRLDEWLLSLRRAKENLKKYKASVLKSAVEWKLTESFRKTQKLEPANILLEKILEERKKKFLSENPGKKYKEPEGIKQDDLPNIELPEGWEFANFWQVTDIESNLVNPKDYENYNFIAPDHIEKFSWILLENVKVSDCKVISPKHLFKPNRIIYSKIRPNLSKLVISNSEWLCSADMYPIYFFWNLKYLFYFMLSKNFLDYSTTSGSRTILPKINQKELSVIPITFPPLSEQNEIVKIVESKLSVVEKLEKLVDENIKRSENLKQSILKKAFEWELVREE